VTALQNFKTRMHFEFVLDVGNDTDLRCMSVYECTFLALQTVTFFHKLRKEQVSNPKRKKCEIFNSF